MKIKLKTLTKFISSFFKGKFYRNTALLLVICMIFSIMPNSTYTAAADENSTFQAKQADNNGNYAVLDWSGTAGSKFAVEKSDDGKGNYETIPLKYSIKVLNVYPDIGNNLKTWMETDNMGSPTIDGTNYSMTVDEIDMDEFDWNPAAYMGTAGNWKYDVIYFGAYDANGGYDISLDTRNLLEQFIKCSGGVLLGHDTAAFSYSNFQYIASKYLDLQATTADVSATSPDFIPTYGNTQVKVAEKGLLTNYPYALGKVGTILDVPESHTYHEFASANVWFTYNGTNAHWDPSALGMTTYKSKTGTNNFYLTTKNNVAMIQTGHTANQATTDEKKILTNTLYYLAQTTDKNTFEDHSAQDLTAPGKVSGSATVLHGKLSFTEAIDAGNSYSYKLYTVDDVNGTKNDTGKTAQVTVKTGLKGYSYVIDQNKDAIGVDATVDATSASIDVSAYEEGDYYLHIRAVDNAGNVSDESILPFTIKAEQPVGIVELSKPLFNNDNSGYTFKSASISNCTNINSITISTTKGTTVQSLPAFLEPSSKTESSDSTTNTYTYLFDSEITASQAEEFIHGIMFNYVEDAVVSLSVVGDSSAIDTYSLATDGGVEEGVTIHLNTPVYGNDKSVFSFANAEVKNISTVYSLTLNMDNCTNVTAKPATPVVSNELKNIAGTTNIVTYQFENGITLAQAQSFLRGIQFNYGGLKNSSTTNVSVTVDGNKTNLPKNASITELNGHYYMYVPSDYIAWTDAYNLAKTYTYMGLKGYLATVTSQDEDKVLRNISEISAWSAGSRYLNLDSSKLMDPDSVDIFSFQHGAFYYWACGPEAGTVFYNSISPTVTPGAGYTGYKGAYNNWGSNPRQPDAYNDEETCMQVNWPYDDGANGQMRWNDLPNEGLPHLGLVKGYFVEFSDYENGRVDGFVQTANGKSVASVSVEKGDIFNPIKEGATYYVDTVLKTTDSSITNIAVNNKNVTNGSKLAGNTNTDYTIVTTDLEGNTYTMTVKMKSIASISDSISNLTVNNVQLSDKAEILAVKATLIAIDTTNASEAQITEINNAIQNCETLCLAMNNATPTAVNGTNGWYGNGIDNIMLTAPNGFEISTSTNGAWTNDITVDKADGVNKVATYYLKETATGKITAAKTYSYNVDTLAPTGSIKVKNNEFKSFINTITFGLIYNDDVDVTIEAEDSLSGIRSIEYQKVDTAENFKEDGAWVSASALSVSTDGKFIVYARLTDKAGNVTIINTNGVVLDKTKPAAPVLLATVNNKSSNISGTAEVGASIHILDAAGNVIGNGIVGTDGTFSVVITCQTAGTVLTIMVTDEAGNTNAVTVTVQKLPNTVSDMIDALPNPKIATDEEIIAVQEAIKETKKCYDKLNNEERNSISSDRKTKLDELLSRLKALFVVAAKDDTTGIMVEGIGTAVVVDELQSADVSKVEIALEVRPSNSNSATNLAIAENRLTGSGQNLVSVFEISLIKSVFGTNGTLTSSARVNNSDIVDYITIRIPIPAAYVDRTDLQIVYIDEDGNLVPLETSIVTINGIKYLEFKTNHFSTYAIATNATSNNHEAATQATSTPVASTSASVDSPDTGDTSSTLNYLIMLGICAILLVVVRKRREEQL